MIACKQFSFKFWILGLADCDLVFFNATGLTDFGDFPTKDGGFIFGGGEIYKLSLNFCSQIELTLVDINLNKGVSFPFIDEKKWKKKLIQKVEGNESYPPHSFWVYNRK